MAKMNHRRIRRTGSCKSGKSTYDSSKIDTITVVRVCCSLRGPTSQYLVLFESGKELELNCWIQDLLGILKPELVTKLPIKTCELPIKTCELPTAERRMEGINNDHAAAVNQSQPPPAHNQPSPLLKTNHNLLLLLGNMLTSDVWVHFSRKMVNGVLKARCKYCLKLLSGDSNSGTSHLRNHNRTCIRKKIYDGQQKVMGPNFLHKGKAQLVATEYNSEVCKKELCSMILIHEYPLSMVDHLGFKRFCCPLQPLFKVPCRNTIKKVILTLYEFTKTKIQRDIDGNRGRVAVTTDMWTATNQKRGYMAITGHYIDNSWQLRSILFRVSLCSSSSHKCAVG
ncbi:Zinc finger BED domain-containing protein DAYSLEEPER [Linum perenne]